MSKTKYHRGRRRKKSRLNITALDRKPAGRLVSRRAAADKAASGKMTLNQVTFDRGKMKLAGAGILFLFVILFVQMASASGKDTSAQITLAVNDTEILQDEAVPAMTVTARCPEGQQELLLEESSGYRQRFRF